MRKAVNTKMVGALMPPEQHKALNDMAKFKGCSMSELARVYITKGLNADQVRRQQEQVIKERLVSEGLADCDEHANDMIKMAELVMGDRLDAEAAVAKFKAMKEAGA